MVTADLIARRIREMLPGARVELTDLTGGGDHWQALIVSDAFAGQTRIARQRAVFSALGDLMNGPIHALTLRTLTREQAGENMERRPR